MFGWAIIPIRNIEFLSLIVLFSCEKEKTIIMLNISVVAVFINYNLKFPLQFNQVELYSVKHRIRRLI